MNLTPEVGKQLVNDLTAAAPLKRGAVIKRYMVLTDLSRNSVYRLAAKSGYSSGRKKRTDSGKTALTRKQVLEAVKMIKKTQRQKKTAIMPATRANKILFDSGDYPKVSSSTLNRMMRKHKTSKREMAAPSPHITMRSHDSNHVHQFDTSNCVQYFLKDDGSLGERDMVMFYKNKIKNFKKIRKELLRYIITDHKSGAFFVQYFYAEGENTTDQLDFFHQAWAQKESPEKFPFCGVPEMLVTDQGSALTSAVSENLLNRLGVTLYPHKVKNSRAKGTVENAQWFWEQQFESGLRESPAPDLKTLNAWAYDLALYLNATMVHRRYNDSRFSMWLKCLNKQLRLPPPYEIFKELALSNPEERTVSGALTILFKNDEYPLRHIAGIRKKDKVQIFSSPYKENAVVVEYDGQRYLSQRIEKDISGQPLDAPVWGEDFKSHKDTVTETAVKEADNLETGEYQVFGHHADKVEPLHYLPRSGTPIEIKRKIAQISILQAIQRASIELDRPITKAENKKIRNIYGQSIPEEKVAEIVAWLSGESSYASGTKEKENAVGQ